jgi:hypothetical protein
MESREYGYIWSLDDLLVEALLAALDSCQVLD